MKWFTPKRRRWIYGISMALGPQRRRWIYGISMALGPLLVFYGVVEGTAWPLWLAVAQQVLVPGMALNFVPGGDE